MNQNECSIIKTNFINPETW